MRKRGRGVQWGFLYSNMFEEDSSTWDGNSFVGVAGETAEFGVMMLIMPWIKW